MVLVTDTLPSAGRPRLADAHGRTIRKLRVSLTDACGFRCFYCMPAHPVFAHPRELLTPRELGEICGRLVALGITEIRATGGEPTARRDFRAAMEALAGAGAAKLALTSNGQGLARHLPFLHGLGMRHVNISLDSLDPATFRAITKAGRLWDVLDCVEAALALGFRVKINAIVFRGINDGELEDFARWSARTGAEVRFLEYMRIGPDNHKSRSLFVSAAEMLESLGRQRALAPAPVPDDATAFAYTSPDGARLGFIASESRPFCGHCSRLRLSAKGVLRACLFREGGLSLRHVPPERYPSLVAEVLGMKPLERLPEVAEAMHAIGG